MSNGSQNEVPDFLGMAKKMKRDVRRYVRVYCLKWFDDSFQNQGFTDGSFVAWEKRKEPDHRVGGAILENTTYLRKSLEVMSEDNDSTEFGTTVPYAGLHNNGGRLRVIQYVRAHTRTRKGKREQVQAHSRKIDTKFPKRQFIGHSEKMMSEMDLWLVKEIEKRFKEL
jgi:phage gpG-like protein